MRAPEEGRSRRLRSREAPVREGGGTFLPTTRPDDLSQPDRRPRLQRASWDEAPRPTGRLPPLRRPPAAPTGAAQGAAPASKEPLGATAFRRPADRPSSRRKASAGESGLASRLDDHPRRAEARPAAAIDTGRSALGRAATARGLAHPRLSPQGRVGSDSGPTHSRSAASLTPNGHLNNHAEGRGLQISVHRFPGNAQTIQPYPQIYPQGAGPG
jgi:hypothetical protein